MWVLVTSVIRGATCVGSTAPCRRQIATSATACKHRKLTEFFFWKPWTMTSRDSNAVLHRFYKEVGRTKVHYPKDGNYTWKPLKTSKTAGRDPETGRILVHGLGGGNRVRARWVDYLRDGPTSGPPRQERVLSVRYDSLRTAHIALVGEGTRLRWIVATYGMSKGDIISTSREIPRNPVRAKPGDAWPLAALPVSTRVCCIELTPGSGGYYCRAAGSSASVVRKVGDLVTVGLPSKHEVTLDGRCVAVVGQVSNPTLKDYETTAVRLRYSGFRPDSGEHHKKDGYSGRKVKSPWRRDMTQAGGGGPPDPQFWKLTSYEKDCDRWTRPRAANVADFKRYQLVQDWRKLAHREERLAYWGKALPPDGTKSSTVDEHSHDQYFSV